MQETDNICDYCKGQLMTDMNKLCVGCCEYQHFEGIKILRLD